MSLTPRMMTASPAWASAHRAAPVVRGFCLLAMGALLAACVDDTQSVSVAPARGASAESAVEGFVIAVATADVIGDNCREVGISKGYSSVDALLASYVRNLAKAGYTESELVRATDRLDDDRIGEAAIARLKARGVREGDTASLCRYGREEIAAGSAIGRLLRTSG